MELDKDLASIQEARDLVRKAKAAQAVLAEMDQQQVDRIVTSMAHAAEKAARPLAAMAVKDTGFGREEDKVVKNLFAARTVYGRDFARIRSIDQLADTVGLLIQNQIRNI